MSWTMIAGVILILYAGYSIYTGCVGSGDEDGRTFTWITRTEKPV